MRTSDGAFVMNEKNQVIFWNRAAERLLGYTAEEAAGRLCYEVLGGRDEAGQSLCQRYCRIAVRAAQGKTLPNVDVFAQMKNGKRRWLNVTTFAYPAGDPEIGDVIVHLFRDITDDKENARFVDQILEVLRERSGGVRSTGVRSGGNSKGGSGEGGDERGHAKTSQPAAEAAADPHFDALTAREQEVLHLLAHGLGTDDIADELTISPATTRNHVQSVLNKLKVHSRLEAVAYAYQQGLIEVGD